MNTSFGARESVGINALMTPIFKTSKPVNRNTFMTPTFTVGKPVDMKNFKKPAFRRRASVGAAQSFKKRAEERDGMSVFKAKKHKHINNLLTPVFGCGVSVRAASAFMKKSKVNKGIKKQTANILQGGWGRKRSFISTVNPPSSSTLETTDNWFATPKTQKMDIDFPTGESSFPRSRRSAGLTRKLPGQGKVGTHAGDKYKTPFQKPTIRTNVRSKSLQMLGDKELGVSYKQDVKFPATPKNCSMFVCPPVGAPQHKQLFINIENPKPFPRSDAFTGTA